MPATPNEKLDALLKAVSGIMDGLGLALPIKMGVHQYIKRTIKPAEVDELLDTIIPKIEEGYTSLKRIRES